MKTINQVLLALLFIAFSTVGFAQTSTNWPSSTVRLNDDIRFEDYDINDDEDDESNGHTNEDTENELEELRYLQGQNGNRSPLTHSNYVVILPNRE